MGKIIKVKDHIENLEKRYEKDEFTLSEIIDYIDSLNIIEDNVIEVIPGSRKEFSNGILAVVRYK